MEPHRVYLIPGLFGFGELAGYDYFEHVEDALRQRFETAGEEVILQVVATPATASIRRRAQVLAATIFETARNEGGKIHLVGHSTGGLDARLLASPTSFLDLPAGRLDWRERLDSVVTINAPHYGTPLAGFFATVSGTHLLYALSLLTFTTLSVGGPPLTVFSALVAALGRLDNVLGMDIQLLDRATEMMLKVVGNENRNEVRDWLDGIRKDQGAVIQITPESMDIFNAAAEDAANVRYGCMAASSPPPRPVRLLSSMRSPYSALSATIYSMLYSITAREHEMYPYPAPDEETHARLVQQLGLDPSASDNDGIVPTLSMLWGDLIWAGRMDHLDSVGHFPDDRKPNKHTDWLISGAQCDRKRFADSMNALASFLLG